MLTTYRRHLKTCEHRAEGRRYRRCHCPIWVDGFLGSREIRQSLRLRDWQRAQDKIREWEAEGEVTAESREPIAVADACDAFLADAEARGLREPTLYKYRLLFKRLREFAAARGVVPLAGLNLPMLRDFRAGWADHNLAAMKKLERLRAFFRFGHDAGWIADNPARLLKNPKVTNAPTLPFTQNEVVSILAACDKYPDRMNAIRLRALVLLLRYSGLRIRDAVTLQRDRVQDGKLFLSQAKTGVVVWCPLPPFVIAALEAIGGKGTYYFWTGTSEPKSCVGDWQRALRRLFQLAGVPTGHAHRFRDTFAVELLLAGVPLERVSVLLGHQSIRVTERHYAPWVRARQEQLEADVRRTWGVDPVPFVPTKGTPQVHSEGRRPN